MERSVSKIFCSQERRSPGWRWKDPSRKNVPSALALGFVGNLTGRKGESISYAGGQVRDHFFALRQGQHRRLGLVLTARRPASGPWRRLRLLHRVFLIGNIFLNVKTTFGGLDVIQKQHELWGVSYLSLLRNWLAEGEGSPDITWFELYLDFRIATQRNVPWNQGGTCDAPRYAMDPQPGYEIVPRPPLRNFASSVSHLAIHLGARVLPTFCVEVKRCNSLTRAFAFEAAVGLSCRPQLVCPSIFQTTLMAMFRSGDISLSVLTLLFLLSHLVSRFLRSLWMYSFRLLENVPLRLVNAVGLGLRDLSLGALVLFRPLRLCASCTSHRGPSPLLEHEARITRGCVVRKVPRKVPLSRTTCPSRSVSWKRMCLRVMGF